MPSVWSDKGRSRWRRLVWLLFAALVMFVGLNAAGSYLSIQGALFSTTSAQVPFQINNAWNFYRFNSAIVLFCFSFLRWDSLGWNISPILEESGNGYLTLKHKLVLLEAPQSSGHLGSGVVVGARWDSFCLCVCTQILLFSHLKTSHKPLQP